jgi:hypothetical protein
MPPDICRPLRTQTRGHSSREAPDEHGPISAPGASLDVGATGADRTFCPVCTKYSRSIGIRRLRAPGKGTHGRGSRVHDFLRPYSDRLRRRAPTTDRRSRQVVVRRAARKEIAESRTPEGCPGSEVCSVALRSPKDHPDKPRRVFALCPAGQPEAPLDTHCSIPARDLTLPQVRPREAGTGSW